MSRDHLNHQNSPSDSANWQYGNSSMNMPLPNSSLPMYQGIQMAPSSSCPQVSMAESFYPNPWNNPNNSVPIGKPIPLSQRLDMGMFLPANPGVLHPSLSDFPSDSSFIERAAKFSSFSAGNFSALVNPQTSIDHGSRCESPVNNQRDNGSGREETSANVSEDSSSKGLNVKKRKKNSQDMELDQAQENPKENVENKQNVECSSSTPATGKSKGKDAKDSTDGAKQDYIHVRARRGQATNSHSLAERVRRERISERMKYLQDLVPGCSKVTGKAVMLDEIINYVQSLQRQVEFLSMKLAAVNPSINLNIEALLSKDIAQTRAGQSPMGFSTDLIHPQFLQSQPGSAQAGIHSMMNHADALRRTLNAQFSALSAFKEPTPQMSNPWDAELQSMVQMNFGNNPAPSTQEFNGKPHDGFQL
ncbi:uncharacterized protein A4U43_UnF8490 [Asparagus officinalis]|uniref:BHLH domain-containing protein n=1 Tax=Asparagus officinalis TaxID=4686 RepID=A0A1R3L5Y7_ASPOF|nr:transcription factor bHLH49-like [Asparagus officinalis]ONK55018.1 uncharacterized protein A4U43_UnF8490 [Asparagus officinalis]